MSKKTNDLTQLTRDALREVAKNMGLHGYSKLRKDDLLNLIISTKEARRQAYEDAVRAAQDLAKEEIGKDYSKAVAFYKNVHSLKNLTPDDYSTMSLEWKILTTLSDEVVDVDITKICLSIRKIFCIELPVESIHAMSEDEKKNFIQNYIDVFKKDTRTTTLKKATYSMLKMSLSDLEYDSNGKLIFDSRKAVRLDSSDIAKIEKTSASLNEQRERKSVMRYVDTAEDGIYRILKTKKGNGYDAAYAKAIEDGLDDAQAHDVAMGLSMVTVNLAEQGREEEEKKAIESKKRDLFTNGFTDIASNTHYLFAFQNPSSTRKANFMCVEADDYKQIYQLWYEVTGTGNHEGFQKAFHANEGVVLAKMLARTSSKGSNSIDVNLIADKEYAETIRNAKILYIPDASATINRPYKTLVSPNVLSEMNEERTITPGDGGGWMSFKFNAELSAAMKIISGNQYKDFNRMWAEVGMDAQKANLKPALKRIIMKTGRCWQIRGGEESAQSDKGMLNIYNYENITVTLSEEMANKLTEMNGVTFTAGQELKLGDYDIIIPESVRKFVGDVNDGDFHLEVCNHLKSKGDWVCMNPQFIAALNPENPNIFTPIIEYWFNVMDKSFDNIAELQHFMNIVSYSDDDESAEHASANLGDILVANYKLSDDPQVLKMCQDKFTKFIDEMRIGKIRVPGMYTYMICDPGFIFNNIFGTDVHELQSGQYWHNNKTCRAGLFRSPLIAPFEAQRVQLVEDNMYWYLKDTIVFNGYDGAWDRMGGGDFDGDTCAVITEDDPHGFGKIVVDAIREIPYDIWEAALKASKEKWTEDDNTAFIEYLVRSAKRDRTGEITNHATRILDISNSLVGLTYFAKYYNCNKINFISPEAFGKSGAYKGRTFGPYGRNFTFDVVNGTLIVRGLVEMAWDNDAKKYIFFNDAGILGEKTIDEVIAISQDKMKLVEILRILQGREIDGAKTGVYAEGPSGKDYTNEVKCKLNPHWLIKRQEFLKRVVYEEMKETNKNNVYISFSMMGRIHDYTTKNENRVLDRFKQGTGKISLLKFLLSEQEIADMQKVIHLSDGTSITVMNYIEKRKTQYNTAIFNLTQSGFDSDETDETIGNLKEKEAKVLSDIAEYNGISRETVAACAYLVTYGKDSKQNSGLSYAWILYPELLSIFSRDNSSFELFKVPDYAETVRIENGMMYVNDTKYMPVHAENGEVLINYFGGTKAYGLVKKINGQPVVARVSRVSANAEFEIGVFGFGYANRESANYLEWQKSVSANGHVMQIVHDNHGSLCTAVTDAEGNQHILAQVLLKNVAKNDTDIMLLNRTVKVIGSPNYKVSESGKTISGLRVRVIE